MDQRVKQALKQGGTIDITTKGRTSGKSHRVEIWFHNLGSHLYITGRPGRRDWYANMLANPEFTFHLKQGVRADLPARATPVLDEATRREFFSFLLPRLDKVNEIETWMTDSPLVEVAVAEA